MTEFFQAILDWVANHRAYAELAVFLICFAESMLILGLILPGIPMMFGIGTLIAAGALDLWNTLFMAILGGVAGDSVGWWLGWYFKDRLLKIWPFSRYPQALSRGESFFYKHGGKSVFFGRFFGPVRQGIPVVAGMLGMGLGRFTFFNITSAIIWAPAFMLPGIVFGASMAIASQVATRLAVLSVGFVALVWFTWWIGRRIYIWVTPQSAQIIAGVDGFGTKHPSIRPVTNALVNPAASETRGLTMLAVILLAVAALFLEVERQLFTAAGIARFDTAIMNFMHGLRSPYADQLMGAIGGLGQIGVIAPLAIGMLAWFFSQRQWVTGLHWLAAVSFGVALAVTGQWVTTRAPALASARDLFGSMGVVATLYAFLASLIARELSGSFKRFIPYGIASLVIVLIAAARLYLGAENASAIFARTILGVTWALLLGLALRRHTMPRLALTPLIGVSVTIILLANAWYIQQRLPDDLARYTPRLITHQISFQSWWTQEAWQALPEQRIDLGGNLTQPLTLQWAGDRAHIERQLRASGWHRPDAVTFNGVLRWLMPEPTLKDLPVLPQAHDGQHEALLLVRPSQEQPGKLLSLRLWPTPTRLSDEQVPVWVGTLTWLKPIRPIPWFTLLRTDPHYSGPLLEALPQLGADTVVRHVTRQEAAERGRIDWDGRMQLLAPRALLMRHGLLPVPAESSPP